MAGHFRDPRVGRDVLIGVVVEIAVSLVDVGKATIFPWLDTRRSARRTPIFRCGLLAFAIAWFVWNVASNAAFVQDWSHWSAAAGNWTLVGLIGVTLFRLLCGARGSAAAGTILRE